VSPSVFLVKIAHGFASDRDAGGCASREQRRADVPGDLARFRVTGDGIPEAIGGAVGDADRGRALILGRESANCVLCHAFPDPGVRFSGNVGPSLGGVARTLSVAQLRLRVVDNARVNAQTVMPSYYRVEASTASQRLSRQTDPRCGTSGGYRCLSFDAQMKMAQ
jgi:sulfur-oxidizing protein SoxX